MQTTRISNSKIIAFVLSFMTLIVVGLTVFVAGVNTSYAEFIGSCDQHHSMQHCEAKWNSQLSVYTAHVAIH